MEAAAKAASGTFSRRDIPILETREQRLETRIYKHYLGYLLSDFCYLFSGTVCPLTFSKGDIPSL